MTTTLEEGFRALDIAGNVHDIDEKRHQAIFRFPHDDQPDSFRSSWDPYVFEDSLRSKLAPGGRGLPCLWQHMIHEPIGKAIGHESLSHETRIRNRFSDFDAVPRAKQAFSQLRSGEVGGVSFHFSRGVARPHRTQRNAIRYVKAELHETSVVTAAAIKGASATDLRSRAATFVMDDEFRAAVDRWRPLDNSTGPSEMRFDDPLNDALRRCNRGPVSADIALRLHMMGHEFESREITREIYRDFAREYNPGRRDLIEGAKRARSVLARRL